MFPRFFTRLSSLFRGSAEEDPADGSNDLRIEVLKNGERVCVIGTHDGSLISVTVAYVDSEFTSDDLTLQLSGMGWHQPEPNEDGHVVWPAPPIEVGDEVTFRLLAAGEFDAPIDAFSGDPVSPPQGNR